MLLLRHRRTMLLSFLVSTNLMVHLRQTRNLGLEILHCSLQLPRLLPHVAILLLETLHFPRCSLELFILASIDLKLLLQLLL